jgi:hypothetical protein
LPFARPGRVQIGVNNRGSSVVNLAAGRRLLDPSGKVYLSESALNLAAGASGSLSARQMVKRDMVQVVNASQPFYAIQIPPPSDPEMAISGLSVSVNGIDYPYTPAFFNLAAGQVGYALETDELRRLWVRFGFDSVFGVQPANGATIRITVEETAGKLDLAPGAAFSLESITASNEAAISMNLTALLQNGADPIGIDTLRELAKYPASYNDSAVYLGDFAFLIRKNLPNLRFLSVWNEQIEEAARGPSVNNINRLFIAVLMDGVAIDWLQGEITRIIQNADDCYRITFIAVVDYPIPVQINAQVATVHDPDAVKASMQAAVLALYGRDAPAVRTGMFNLSHKTLSHHLRDTVSALQAEGSDFQMLVTPPARLLPEQFRYVSSASLQITVTQALHTGGLWTH